MRRYSGDVGKEIVELDVSDLINKLNVAYADEWLAYYQYWIGAKVLVGSMRKAVEQELIQHADDEEKHAGMLADRIIQLGGKPLLSPTDWLEFCDCGFEAPTDSAIASILKQNIHGEQSAIRFYKGIIDLVRDVDDVTYEMISSILKDEVEHEEDLQMLEDDMNAGETGKLKTAANHYPPNVRPDTVFAFKYGSYDNSNLDMGQYEEQRNLSVAICKENDKIVGWWTFNRNLGRDHQTKNDGKIFGPVQSVNHYSVSAWTTDLFRKFLIDEPKGWSGPSMGRGNFKLSYLFDMLEKGDTFESKYEDLTWSEKVVLASFALKSSYAGIKDYRKYDAMRHTDISDEEYDAAKASLKKRGLVTNNALSPMGREVKDNLNLQLWQLHTRTASQSRTAGPGMSQEAFYARVRRLLQKVAVKYGGTYKGFVAFGTTEDGKEWGASIQRLNASNGEVAGNLVIRVKETPTSPIVKYSDVFGWDRLFQKAGIPVVSNIRL